MPLRQAILDEPVLHIPAKRSDYTARSRVEALFEAPDVPADNLERWRKRRLEPAYTIVFFDSLAVRVREQDLLSNKRIHLALGVLEDGSKDILAYWVEPPRANQFWTFAAAELRLRGVTHIDFAVVEDGAAGQAIADTFPAARVYGSIKHAVHTSIEALRLGARARAQKDLHRFFNTAPASATPDDLAKRDVVRRNPALADYWRQHWDMAAPLLALPAALRQLLCSTSAGESVIEKRRRRGLAKRTSYASVDSAVRELLFVLRDAKSSWKISPRAWAAARADLTSCRPVQPAAED